MTIFRTFGPPLALAAGLVFGAGTAALAGATGEKEKDKEKQDAPDQEGHGTGMSDHAKKNPLPEIVDLMRKVEERLAEAETDDATRATQDRIVKALEGEQAALERLKKLIKEIEDCPE